MEQKKLNLDKPIKILIVKKQNLRLAHMDSASRTAEMIRTVEAEDIQGFSLKDGQNEEQKRGHIGFNRNNETK